MNYLLDTNVVSELFKKSPNPHLVRWLGDTRQDSLFLSVLTIGEIRKGVETMMQGSRKASLVRFLDKDVQEQFEQRILPVDVAVAEAWGTLEARAGRPLSTVDALLAATAMVHNLTLVTRNVRDFTFTTVNVLNPWS